jgi:dephospho-CoA kinase
VSPGAVRIAVIGLSGSGKSTCAGELAAYAHERNLSFARVKLARPLYELQRRIYAAAGVPLREGAQDQVLMEDLAGHLRRLNARSLAEDFTARLAAAEAAVLVNDDLRDPHVDAPALRAAGFRILRITCDEAVRQRRLTGRGDPTRADRSTRELDLIELDHIIDNSGDLAAFRTAIRAFARSCS